MGDKNPSTTSYPISHQLTVNFSLYEDRLIVRAQLTGVDKTVQLLLTRRMVMIVLRKLLDELPALTGLEKTPGTYWQEVLSMGHQQAMQAKAAADKAAAKATEQAEGTGSAKAGESVSGAQQTDSKLYLATELTVQLSGQKSDQQVLLAFKGLPMPAAMTEKSPHLPVFAIPLKADNVHQLIELIIGRCKEAHWHLPLDLPWLNDAAEIRQDSHLVSSIH